MALKIERCPTCWGHTARRPIVNYAGDDRPCENPWHNTAMIINTRGRERRKAERRKTA